MQPGTTPIVRAEVTSATTSTNDLCHAVLLQIQERLGAKRFAVWCDGKIRLAISDDRLTIAVGSPFLLNWMQKQFHSEMTAAAQTVLGPSAEKRIRRRFGAGRRAVDRHWVRNSRPLGERSFR